MDSKNYLLIGLGSVILLVAITLGTNFPFPSGNYETTKIMVSLDSKNSSTIFVDYKPTNEVFSSNGMTINFSENKIGPTTINCTLSCQPLEDDTK